MQRIWFGQSECRGKPVYYYLVTEKRAERENYGLQVRYGNEMETVPDITNSLKQIRQLLGMLTRGTVTPVAVRDVVEDWRNSAGMQGQSV